MLFTNVGEWHARREALTPHRIGLVDIASGSRYTYSDLNTRAQALAALLAREYGVRAGDRIAALADNAPEYLDAFFACALLGAIFTPLNWRLTHYELAGILADCAPVLLLHDAAYHQRATDALQRWGRAIPLLAFDAFPGADAALAALAQPMRLTDGEEPALILYTSGTTGAPKGAILSHRMLTWNAINTQVSWGLAESDSAPISAPFFHAGGLNVLTTPLFHLGGSVALMRNNDPALLLKTIAAERNTIVFAVPTVFQALMEHPAFASTDLSSVRFCVTGGAPCPLSVIQGYAARGVVFRQGYGLTEVGVNCFSLAPEDALRKAGSVGRPVFHSTARLVDVHEQEVPAGEVGELELAGPHLCSGYWGRPEATAEALHDGWWRTGDLARRDDEGYYYIVGRKKEMYISGGENVYPAEVEAALATHPGIAEVAVIAEPDTRWGEVGVAIVVPRTPGQLSAEDVITFCRERLARYKNPRRVVFVTALPRNAMGKVVKAELRQQARSQGAEPQIPRYNQRSN